MKRCSPPARAISPSPGLQIQVIGVAEDDLGAEVLEVAVRHALTAPRVPTGMNAGVWTTPCGVAARRAAQRRRG